jgi:hypothetical protein
MRSNILSWRDVLDRARSAEGVSSMPAKSRAQQMAAGAALSVKRGKRKKTDLKGAAKSMVDSMDENQLHDLASTPQKGKPDHVSESSRESASRVARMRCRERRENVLERLGFWRKQNRRRLERIHVSRKHEYAPSFGF